MENKIIPPSERFTPATKFGALEQGVKIVHPKEKGEWAIFFEKQWEYMASHFKQILDMEDVFSQDLEIIRRRLNWICDKLNAKPPKNKKKKHAKKSRRKK